jgi:glycosyltransferase involved in cell wall biosynthesis
MNGPLVSVIIPVFNGGQYIRGALESAFGQQYRPIEVIVVDDGSTDNTAEIVRFFKDVTYLHQSNQGVPAARDVGISIAQGEFIAFLDADDLWTRDKLNTQISWLLEHPDIAYVTAKFRNFLEKDVKRPWWVKEEHLLEDQKGGVPNLVVRKSVFEKIGVFDANCRSGSDLDWVLRAKDAGFVGTTLPHTLLHRRIHDSNLSYQWQGGRALLLKSLKASIDRQQARKSSDKCSMPDVPDL